MQWLTYVFPVIMLGFVALFFIGCPALELARLAPRGKKSFTRRDAAILSAITILYAFAAFYNLGDKTAPQSFYHFDTGDELCLDLGETKTVGDIMFYSGLNTGTYRLYYSEDGLSWFAAGTMKQESGSVFKWNSADFTDDAEARTRYIKICANSELYLGEIAVKSPDGELYKLNCDNGLCDEQELVPEYMYYLNSTYFDEVYHARTAYEHIVGMYPYEVSHPPLGKLIIAAGIKLFGMTPFGWRVSGTLTGVLMLPVIYVFLKRMFGGLAVPSCGTVLLATDFMHFTQTRIATIDTYAVFFMLLMYLFMYLYVSGGRLRHLALSGLFFGIGAACKWTCIYSGAGLAVIWLAHWVKELKNGEKFSKFIKNCLFCVVFFVIVPCAVYYASYFAYGTALGMKAPEMFISSDYAKVVLDNQKFMLSYHEGVNSPHPYSSRWYQWIFDVRPILYFLRHFTDGTRSSFGAFVNPMLCWAGFVSLFLLAYLAIWRRDRISAFILVGYLAHLLPWLIISRTTFEYHYFQSAVWLIFALCRVFSLMRENSRGWRLNVYGLTAISAVLFVVFYPAISGARVNDALASALLKWLPSWPF